MANIFQRIFSRSSSPEPVKSPRSQSDGVRSDLSSPQVETENPRNLYGYYTNELRDFKPNQLIDYLEWSRKGLNFFKSTIFEETRRKDLRIGAVCRTRKYAAAKKEWDVKFGKESEVPESIQKERIGFIKHNLKHIKFTSFISDCTEAQIQGVSTFEINYKIDASTGKNLIGFDSIKYIPNYVLLYDDIGDAYHYLAKEKCDMFILRQYVCNTTLDRIDVMKLSIPDPNPFKMLEVHSLDGNAQNGFQNGLIDALLYAFMFKSYCIKDWHTFIERFATPAIVGKFDPLMNKDERGTFFNAIKSWGRLFKLMIPNNATIDLLKDQSAGQSSQIFKENQSYWNEEISIGVLGNPLTVNVTNKGSLAAAEVADVVRQDILVADMMVVKEAANELIDRLYQLNFPDEERAEFSFKAEADLKFQEVRARVVAALRQTGYKADREQLEEEFNISLEDAPVAGAGYDPTSAGGGPGNPNNPDENNPPDEKGSGQFTRKFTSSWIEKYLKQIARQAGQAEGAEK
jgi:phage gp29-like protein